MKKFLIAITLLVVSIVGVGCAAATAVSLDEQTVNDFFTENPVPEGVTLLNENVDGKAAIDTIYEQASTKVLAALMNIGDNTSLQGQFDGVWYYGWGSNDRLLLAYGDDKDTVYDFM